MVAFVRRRILLKIGKRSTAHLSINVTIGRCECHARTHPIHFRLCTLGMLTSFACCYSYSLLELPSSSEAEYTHQPLKTSSSCASHFHVVDDLERFHAREQASRSCHEQTLFYIQPSLPNHCTPNNNHLQIRRPILSADLMNSLSQTYDVQLSLI